MESQYPPQLSYNSINPKGFFSTFKQWTIQPIASGGVFWPGQNVKILIQSIISGVMDPYRSHLQFQVQVDPQLLPVGGLQVDSSAQSFIQQLVISSKNKQIQRIPQYSVLAAWLTDCGLAQMYAQGRQTQGLGYTNIDSASKYMNSTITPSSIQTKISGHTGAQICHTATGSIPTQHYGTLNRICGVGTNNQITKHNMSRLIKGHFTPINPTLYPDQAQTSTSINWNSFGTTVSKANIAQFGCQKNIRAQYLASINNKNFADSTSSVNMSQVQLDRSVFGTNSFATWQTGKQYLTKIEQTSHFRQYWGANDVLQYIPNRTSLHGFTSLQSPNFSKGVNQPFISPTIPQCQIKNGKILKTKIPIPKKTFKVPIISAILGLLIPQDQFVLLPIKALNQVLMQFVIDKYAMFTTGYNDISQIDDVGISIMQQRAFNIKRVFYKMHTYQFYSPQIDQYLNQSLLDKILLNCNMWTLGNQYQVIKGQNLNNSWPVACTSQALNQIVVLFVPLDYQLYSFCRKHFRISNNITKFQLRINMDYFPSQPLLGNGGNPLQIQGLDNSAFVQQIFWSNNFMFNKVNPWPRINAYNFSINERCYDVTNKQTFYDKAMLSAKHTYQWKQTSVNADTAMGMPYVHQNRYVGKAGYVYGFQPYAHSANHLTGMDCRQVRQFDVLLNTHPYDNFPRQQTMYIFTRSSVIVQYGPNGINVYGR